MIYLAVNPTSLGLQRNQIYLFFFIYFLFFIFYIVVDFVIH